MVTSQFKTLRRNMTNLSSSLEFFRQSFHLPIITQNNQLGTPKIHDIIEYVSREVLRKGQCGDTDWIIGKSHCRLFTSTSVTLLAGTGRKTAGRHSVPVTLHMHQTSVMHSQTSNLHKFLALKSVVRSSKHELHRSSTDTKTVPLTTYQLSNWSDVREMNRRSCCWIPETKESKMVRKVEKKKSVYLYGLFSSNERSSSWDSVDMTSLVWNTTSITAKPRYRKYQRQWFQ